MTEDQLSASDRTAQNDHNEHALVLPRRRLAILDDHILVLDGLSKWVQVNAPDFNVIAAAGSWAELVKTFPRDPEVVIMAQDLEEPVSVQLRIQACIANGAKVVIVSTLDTDEIRKESLEAGASEFVSKACPAAEVVTAARWALNSDVPRVPHSEVSHREGVGGDSGLDETDRAILKLYSTGYSTVDIALIQEIKFEAVRATLKRIRGIYQAQGRQADTRDEMLRRAAEDGYLA